MGESGAARLALGQLRAVLIDLDGVLYVDDQPIVGAREAVERLRVSGLALRFVTNTTARSRSHTLDKLGRLGFAVADEELVTPAALAVAHCARHALRRVALVMNEEVKRDFAELEEADDAQAVIMGGPRRCVRLRRAQSRLPTGRCRR